MTDKLKELENRLWAAADQLRANSKLRSSEYSVPVLGLIFLLYAERNFLQAKARLESKQSKRRRKPLTKLNYQAEGVLFVPEEARFTTIRDLPESVDIAAKLKEAMELIEAENSPRLDGILPKQAYAKFEKSLLIELIKTFSGIPEDLEGDVFGKIYEYFLGNFAMKEGQKGGEFFTPTSVVKLIVEIIQPFKGRILDPACGSGGMFVQSADFVKSHQGNPGDISIYGQERVTETGRLCRMNLAVHGLEGDVRQGNSYYEDPFKSVGKFDFVMANPPFNVNGVDKDRIKNNKKRFPFEMPSVDNGNYLWIQMFYSALNDTGRAGFVMANSASDARHTEQTIREKMIKAGVVDAMVAVSSNFFYTVTLPCTLWFFDKGKQGTERAGKVLFIDARKMYRQVSRAIRDFEPEQIEFLANIVRLYRGEDAESINGSSELMREHFPDGTYQDVLGLCKVATVKEIEAQGSSLNPGRYVGVAEREQEDIDFLTSLQELNEELEVLNHEGQVLEEQISHNVQLLLEVTQ